MKTDVQEAIKSSMHTEKSAMLFYQYGAQQFTDPRAKKTFELLAKEEREHAGHFHRSIPGPTSPPLMTFLQLRSPTSQLGLPWLKSYAEPRVYRAQGS